MAMIKTIRDTLSLIRFPHTIFALPFALASMIVAANGLPSVRITMLIIGCMVLARTSAMAFNRYMDANLDAINPRTSNRHIPQGVLSRRYVLALAIGTGVVFILLTYFLNPLAFYLSPLALVIIWFYSITKHLTHFTQLFLGLALGIAPIGAWIAVRGDIAWPPVVLSAAVLFWVAGFDIFYATQDSEFDQQQGIKSLVVKLGMARALSLAKLFHLLTALHLLFFALFVPSPVPYLVGCLIVIAVLIYENSLVSAHDLSRVDHAFFTLNGWVGIIFLAGTAGSVWLA